MKMSGWGFVIECARDSVIRLSEASSNFDTGGSKLFAPIKIVIAKTNINMIGLDQNGLLNIGKLINS